MQKNISAKHLKDPVNGASLDGMDDDFDDFYDDEDDGVEIVYQK